MKDKTILGMGIFLALAGGIIFYFCWPHEDLSSTPRIETSRTQSMTGTPLTHDREHHEDRSPAPGVEVSTIQSIVRTPQMYDGEIIERLTALGPDAVPAIGQVLLTGVEFPLVLVHALEKIGDPRGAAPTLTFLKGRAPYSDADESTLTAQVILALGPMHNPEACVPLAEIFRESAAHPRVRLAAASAASRLCEGEISGPAADLILEFHRNRSQHMRPNGGFTQEELYTALAEVRNDTATDIVVEVMDGSPPSYLLDPLISAAVRRGDVQLKEALKRVVQSPDPDVALESRLKAARALLGMDGRPDDSLRENVNQLLADAEAGGYPPQTVAEALKLKREYESTNP